MTPRKCNCYNEPGLCDFCLAALRTRLAESEAEVNVMREAVQQARKGRDAARAFASSQQPRVNAAEAKAAQFEQDWVAAKYDFGVSMAKAREQTRAAEAERDDLLGALREWVGALDLCGRMEHGAYLRNVDQAEDRARAAIAKVGGP